MRRLIDSGTQLPFWKKILFLISLNPASGCRIALTLIHYTVWGTLQQLVYCQKIQDIEHLKEVLHSCLDMISQDLIDGAIHQWSKHITMVILAQSSHSEHRVN